VAKAAMDSGVATRPIEDLDAYRDRLTQFVYRSASAMRPVFDAAKRHPKRVAFAEGESRRVLQAAQAAADEGLCRPLLVGRADLIAARIEELALRLEPGRNCEVVNVLSDARFKDAWMAYYQLARRQG